MGGKSSKSKSFDVTTPPAEGAEEKVTKEGNGIVECVSEAPAKSEPEEASKPEENEVKEEAEKPKESEKEKGKDKEKDKEKAKDKEKSDEDKKKKKDKKRSFSFLSKKQKKNKEGANGDVEGKVSTDEAKNENKDSEQAAAEASNTNDESKVENAEEKATEQSEKAKEETVTESTSPAEGEAKDASQIDKENVQTNEVVSTEEAVKTEQVSEIKETKEKVEVKTESSVTVTETVTTVEKTVEAVKTVETSEVVVQEKSPEIPTEPLSPDADSAEIQAETPVEVKEIQIPESEEEKINEDTTAMQADTSAAVIPPTVLPVPEISSSTTVESEIASPESVVNMNICDDKQVEENSPLSSQQNIPEISENTEETVTSVIDNDDKQSNEISSPIPQSPPPVVENSKEIESPVDLDSSVHNEVQTSELVSEQAVLSSGTDLPCDSENPEPVDTVETFEENNVALDLNQSPADIAEPMLISPEEPVIETEPASESDKVVEEQLSQDTTPSKSLAEPAVIVQAATPEPVSDENTDLISSLPTPPTMIDPPSSPELSEKNPSPPPANELDLPDPIENSCKDSDGLPSPDEIPEQPVQVKKTSLVSTKITWEHGGKEVSMTGSFMDWVDSLQLIESDGIFSVAVELPEGEHYCKFLVDGTWTVNSAQPVHELDGQGQVNTILVKVGGNEE